MPVSLAHFLAAVHLRRPRAGAQLAGIRAQPHRAAHVMDPFLRAQQRDHRVLALGLELAGVGVGQPGDVARELDDRRLQAEADAEEWELVRPRPADRLARALHAADAEASRS